jgi:hypothetical protein
MKHTTTPIYRRRAMKWNARCECGWRGPARSLKINAHDDGTAHEQAEDGYAAEPQAAFDARTAVLNQPREMTPDERARAAAMWRRFETD